MGPPSVAPPLAGEPHSNIGEVPELPTSGGVLQFARDAIWSHMESLKQRLQEEFNAVHVDISSVRARRQLLGEQLYNHQKINIDLHQRINSAEQELQELKSKKAEVETRLASARRAVISERQVTEKKKERVTALEKDLCKLSGDLVTAKNEHESEVTDVAATRRAAYVADAMAAQHRRDGRRMHELIDVFKSRLEILVLTKEAMIEQKKALAMEKATFDANVAVVHAQQKTASNDVKTLKKRWRQAVHARGVTDESILRLEDTLNVLRKRTSTARVQYAACMEMTQRIVAAHSQTAERIARAHREEAQAVKRAREADARKGNAEEDSQKLKERRGTLEAASVEIETGLNESRKDINVLQLRIKEIERSGKELDAQCREVLRARRQSTAVGEVAQRQLQQTVALEEEKRMRIDELEKKMKAVHIAMQTESRENEGYLQEMHQARLQLQEEAAALGATQRAVDSAKREIRQRSHTMEMMGRQMRKYEEDPLNKTESPEAKAHRLRKERQTLLQEKQNTVRRLTEIRARLVTTRTHNQELARQLASGREELESHQRELQEMELSHDRCQKESNSMLKRSERLLTACSRLDEGGTELGRLRRMIEQNTAKEVATSTSRIESLRKACEKRKSRAKKIWERRLTTAKNNGFKPARKTGEESSTRLLIDKEAENQKRNLQNYERQLEKKLSSVNKQRNLLVKALNIAVRARGVAVDKEASSVMLS